VTSMVAPDRAATTEGAPADWAEHERTYRGFVQGVVLFTAHVFIILLILAWVFSDAFNTPPVAS